MKVYIASPVRPVFEKHKQNEAIALELILACSTIGCYEVKNMGHTPISPIRAFWDIYDEFNERDKIDAACEALLLSCDAIYVVNTPYNQDSKGIARELEIAKAHDIPILET
jgi:hypothetical protein